MKTTFRLYNRYNASFFNLIEGDKETQQTKGLGLLLAKSDVALQAFLNIKALKNKTGRIDLSKVGNLIVNCELISRKERELRADIVLRFYVNQKPFKALLIEAKSSNKDTSVETAIKQLSNYIDGDYFEELGEFGDQCYGVTLTKSSSSIRDTRFISLTWSEVIEAFYQSQSREFQNDFLSDFTNFIMNINGTMKFYEREVYSIPTSSWSQKAIELFGIYECPTTGPYVIRYKPLFLTFRGSDGGVMEKLFKVDQTIILNFGESLDVFLQDETYDQEIRDNVKGYADFLLDSKIWPQLPNDEKQVIILSKKSIKLKNRPKPKRNNSFRAYYSLEDILTNEIVGMPDEEI